MAKYRYIGPIEMDFPTIPLGGPVEPGEEFDLADDIDFAHALVEVRDGDEWVSSLPDQTPQPIVAGLDERLADPAVAAEFEAQAKREARRAARRAAAEQKRGGS